MRWKIEKITVINWARLKLWEKRQRHSALKFKWGPDSKGKVFNVLFG